MTPQWDVSHFAASEILNVDSHLLKDCLKGTDGSRQSSGVA